MYCPNCGHNNQEGSNFCTNCGHNISGVTPALTATPMLEPSKPVEWEYIDFVYKFRKDSMWVNIDRGGYTINSAKLWFWQEYQHSILAELQNWLDTGWQPVTEVGGGGIQIRSYKAMRYSAVGWIFHILMMICTAFLWLIFMSLTQDQFAEPTEFRVKMRRPKQGVTSVHRTNSNQVNSSEPQQSHHYQRFTLKGKVMSNNSILRTHPTGKVLSRGKSQGEIVAAYGRNDDSSWVQIDEVGVQEAWIETKNIRIDGDVSKLPVTYK